MAKYRTWVDVLLFCSVLSLPLSHFWQRGQRLGIVAVSLAGLGLGKFAYDNRAQKSHENLDGEQGG